MRGLLLRPRALGGAVVTGTSPLVLGADAKDLGGLGYGRTPFVLSAVVIHGPMLYPSEATRKSLEQLFAPLTES